MKLIITEKPSQAAAICAALGVKEEKKHDGYIEGNGIIATWCLGHLVEMAPPEIVMLLLAWSPSFLAVELMVPSVM